MKLYGFLLEKEAEMEPMNGSTCFLMVCIHPHPSFPRPPCIKDCIDHRDSESNPDIKQLWRKFSLVWVSRLHQKGAGETCSRAQSNACSVDCVVLHRAWPCYGLQPGSQ